MKKRKYFFVIFFLIIFVSININCGKTTQKNTPLLIDKNGYYNGTAIPNPYKKSKQLTKRERNQEIANIYNIELASPEQMHHIKFGLYDGNKISEYGYTIKSPYHKLAYYVSAKINDEDVGIWIMNGYKDDPGMILSIDNNALKYTPYPYGGTTKAEASMSDKIAKILKNYSEDEL